jgi:molybdopterin/thiamine biosynthesis adenylyltransferase
MTVSYLRQADLYNPDQHDPHVMVIGLGNIGSNAALTLARMGVRRFTLYDADKVEAHNLNSQAFTVHDLSKYKVEAIAEHMRAYNPSVEIETHTEHYTGQECAADIVISAVDSLEARRSIADALIAARSRPLVIDGRSGGGQIEVYAGTPEEWVTTIPEEASEDACGSRFIAYASVGIGAMIAAQVRHFMSGKALKPRILMHYDTFQVIA